MNAVQHPFLCFSAPVPSQSARAEHTHAAHEFFLCQDGNGTQYAAGRPIHHHHGALFCLPAGMPHYCSALPGAPTVGLVIMVPDDLFQPGAFGDQDTRDTLRDIVALAQGGVNPLPVAADTGRQALDLAERMAEEFAARRTGYQAACRLLLQDLFLRLMRDPGMAAGGRGARRLARHDERLAAVFQHIDEHYRDPVSVDGMARLACLSRSQFHAVFRQAAGCTLLDHVTRVRVQAARRMLAGTDARVLQVALDCGFQTASRFYEAFRAHTGQTPGQARRADAARAGPG